MRTARRIGLGIALAGMTMIIVQAGWLTAVGVFLCIWANNIFDLRDEE